MSVVSFALAVVFIIRLFSTSAFRVPKMSLFSIKLINLQVKVCGAVKSNLNV